MKPIVFLIVITFGDTGIQNESKYPMVDFETCQNAIMKSRVEVATGGDAEASAVVFCQKVR